MKTFTLKLFFYIILTTVYSHSSKIFSAQENRDQFFILGVIDYSDSSKIRSTYVPFSIEIAKQIQKKPIFKIYTYDKLKSALINNEIDMAVFSPNAYIDAKKEYDKKGFQQISAFASHIAKGEKGYNGVIAVRENSSCTNLSDLKGKSFLFTHTLSTSGYKLPYNILINNDIEPTTDFSSSDIFSGSHINSIKALHDGKVDGIATYLEAIQQEPTVKESDFKYLYNTGLIPYNAYVFAPNLNKSETDAIKDFMFHAHENLAVYNKIFKNELNITQWFSINDDHYNSLRPLCGVKRTKKRIVFNYQLEKGNQLNDTTKFLIQRCKDELIGSNRFDLVSREENTINDSISLKIYPPFQNKLSISVYYNTDRIFNYDLKIQEISAFPDFFISKILNYLVIESKIDFDIKNNFWLIHYGANDGINDNYVFEILDDQTSVKLFSNDYSIHDGYTVLNIPHDMKISKGNKVLLRYEEPELNTNSSSASVSIWKNFWYRLDNIWGVIGIIVGLLTGLAGTLLSYRKKKRFKKTLHKANSILKEYFEGKEIEDNLKDLKTHVADLFEKQYIKEQHYQLLKEKISEIKRIVNQRILIPESIKQEIKKITYDGVITEKEYNHLINLIESEEKLK